MKNKQSQVRMAKRKNQKALKRKGKAMPIGNASIDDEFNKAIWLLRAGYRAGKENDPAFNEKDFENFMDEITTKFLHFVDHYKPFPDQIKDFLIYIDQQSSISNA